jgi:hypothetical protein
MSKKVLRMLAVAACAGDVSTAQADVFYGVTSSSLVRMDTVAQSVTTVASITGGASALNSFADCEFDGEGNLWGLRQKDGGFMDPSINQALKINTVTGAALLGGDFGTVSMHGLAFRSSNSSFYSVNLSGAFPALNPGNLVTANTASGAVASVSGASHGLPGNVRVDALAFAGDGTLYGMWNAGNEFMGTVDFKLVRFDTSTGAGTVIGTVSGSRKFNSLRFGSGGVAYTIDSNTGDVFTVNLATGAGSFAFTGGAPAVGVTGLAHVVPAPSALALLAGGAVVGLRRRSRG